MTGDGGCWCDGDGYFGDVYSRGHLKCGSSSSGWRREHYWKVMDLWSCSENNALEIIWRFSQHFEMSTYSSYVYYVYPDSVGYVSFDKICHPDLRF